MEHNKFNQDYVDGLSGPKAWFTKFCNTFGIVNAALGAGVAAGYWDGQPTYRTQFADVALDCNATFVGCTSAFTTGFGIRTVRAYVWLKNYRRGSSTGFHAHMGPVFQLQVATGTGAFGVEVSSTGTCVIDTKWMARATAAYLLSGIVPDNLAYAAARLVCFPQSAALSNTLTDTASFDCNIDATPGS